LLTAYKTVDGSTLLGILALPDAAATSMTCLNTNPAGICDCLCAHVCIYFCLSLSVYVCHINFSVLALRPGYHVGPRVDRLDPIHFLAGCHKSRLNQPGNSSVLSTLQTIKHSVSKSPYGTQLYDVHFMLLMQISTMQETTLTFAFIKDTARSCSPFKLNHQTAHSKDIKQRTDSSCFISFECAV